MSKEINPIEISSDLARFAQLLNAQPLKTEVQEMQGNKYVPISVLEMKLDIFFGGLWQVRNIDQQLIANEIVTTLEVGVFHPIAKEWIWRSGSGAVAIQQRKGAKLSEMVETKIPNALQKNAPASKAFAFKNAVESLGRSFGRDLTRVEEDVPSMDVQMAIQESANEKAIREINEAASNEELGKLFAKHKSIPGIAAKINQRKAELRQLKPA